MLKIIFVSIWNVLGAYRELHVCSEKFVKLLRGGCVFKLNIDSFLLNPGWWLVKLSQVSSIRFH